MDKTKAELCRYVGEMVNFHSCWEHYQNTAREQYAELITSALAAQKLAVTYRTAVGAATQMMDGAIFQGANKENKSRSLDIHAEISAVNHALDAGYARGRDFVALALVYGDEPITDYAYPMCGFCRQYAWENTHPELLAIVVQPNDGAVKFAGPLRVLYPLPYPRVER